MPNYIVYYDYVSAGRLSKRPKRDRVEVFASDKLQAELVFYDERPLRSSRFLVGVPRVVVNHKL